MESRGERAMAAISGVKLQNPFVLRVGQVITGFGMGCGLGVGVGVPIPMDIPGVAQVMSAANGMTRHIGGGRQLQGLEGVAVVKNKLLPRGDGEPQTEAPGLQYSGASPMKISQPAFMPTPLSQLASTPSIKPSDLEAERLRTQNEILRTLLRHQEKIEELEHENTVLREELNMKGILSSKEARSQAARISNPEQINANCFYCRRRSRRRT